MATSDSRLLAGRAACVSVLRKLIVYKFQEWSMHLPGLTRLRPFLPVIAIVAIAVSTSAQSPTSTNNGRSTTRAVLGSQPQQLLLAKITVSDLRRSEDFYSQIVGLRRAMPVGVSPPAELLKPAEPADALRARREIMLNFSGTLVDPVITLIGEPGVAPNRDAARMTWVGFKVPDVLAAVERARKASFDILRDGSTISPQGVRVALIRDPDGYTVELMQTTGK